MVRVAQVVTEDEEVAGAVVVAAAEVKHLA